MAAIRKGPDWWSWALIATFLGCFIILIAPIFLEGDRYRQARRIKTQVDVKNLAFALLNYWGEYKEYPKGDGATIVRMLRGQSDGSQNLKKRRFLYDVKDQDLDERGNYLDSWGHPFVFTFSKNRTRVTVYSLGANELDDGGQEDDIVAVTDWSDLKPSESKNEKK